MCGATGAHKNGVITGAKVLAKITKMRSGGTDGIFRTMQANLLGYGRRIFAKGCGNASKRTLLHEFLFNIYSVRKGEVLTITFNAMTHMSLLSDRQIIGVCETPQTA
jgi:hypothetical protein